tara:strand:- start:11 stop:220 length:210 start_codon:yes stop_codon:yes gene_type:complete
MFKVTLIFIFFFPTLSYAYVGPGIGGGIILATIGIIVAIFAAIFATLWFPIKRFLKKRKENKNKENNTV